MGLACLKCKAWQSGDHICLWITSLAGLKDAVPAEIVHAYGLLAWQA
jgi:hypothetical protein